MTVMTSTMRMQLDAADFVRNAKQVAEAVGADVKKIDALKAALSESGATNKLQASMLKLGAGAEHIEGMKRALADYRKELGVVGKAWSDLTKEEKAALTTFESATAATVRAIIKDEQDLTAAVRREADHRSVALLSKEAALRDKLLAEDRKAEDKRIAILAASAAEKAGMSGREAAARAAVEAEITAKTRVEAGHREGIAREELATIERIAGLEREARVRAITAETAAIVEARHAQRVAEEHAMQHGMARAGISHMVAGTAAAYVSAHGVTSGLERAAEAGSELQDTRLAMRRAGIAPEMRAQLEQQALDLSRRYANVGQVAIMDMQKEALSVLKDQHEVFGTTEVLTKAKAVLDAGGGHSEGLGKLVKGAESIGAANDPVRLAKLIDSYVKAIQVMGATINPDQIYEFDKYLKTAGATVSDRFLMTTGLSLSQEMGGSTAANDIFHAQKDIMGGFQNKHMPIKEMVRMGLISAGDVEYTKTGEAKGIKAGHKGVHGAELAQTDLDEWVYKFLLPALEKHGVKDEKAQLAYVQKVFTGGEGDVIAKLIQQRESFENHGVMYGRASGTGAAGYNSDSATAGLSAFNAALGNLMGNVTVEAMAPVGHVLYKLADWMNVAAQAAKDNPIAALSVGGLAGAGGLAASGTLAYYVATGFGLPAAAGQLVASATALDAAAAKLGAGGATTTAGKVAEAIPGLGIASRLATAIPILGAGLFVADAMINRRDTSKALVDGGRPDALTVNDNNSMLPGFDVGGWTGGGGRTEPAGIVHKEEFVVRQGPAARHRAILEAINRGDILPGYATGGAVSSAYAGTPGLARVALASDSTSAAFIRDVFGGAMLDALRKARDEGDLAGVADGNGSGGGGGGAGHASGTSGANGGPNLRYGRHGDGGHHGAPNMRYGGDHEAGGGGSYRHTPPAHLRGGNGARPGSDVPMPEGGGGKADPSSLKGLLFKGESGGDPGIYNHKVGRRYLTGHLDPNSTTVADLQRRQAAGEIFAAGKYQIIPKTMQGAVKALGLKGDEKFDSALQDRIYTDYLAGSKRPQISAYVTGKSDDLRGANIATAEEWASVGDPSRGGRGHYDGDGANHASISVDRVQAALKKARDDYQRLVQKGVDPETARRSALLGIEHPGNADKHNAAPERTPLSRTGSAAQPAPATVPAPQHHVMSGAVDFDHSSIDRVIAKVDTLHGKLRALRATASVDMHLHHHSHDERTADAGAPKFSPFRSHAPAPAGRITV